MNKRKISYLGIVLSVFMTAFSACDNSSDTAVDASQPQVSASVLSEAENNKTADTNQTDTTQTQVSASVLTESGNNTPAETTQAATPASGNYVFSASNPEIAITSGGTYDISGSASEGRLVVKAGNADVTLNLAGVSLSSAERTVFRVQSAGTVTVNLMPGTTNSFTCTARVDDGGDGINCDTDMVITGTGSLAVSAYGNGIHSDGSLTITDGNITVSNAEEGIEAAQINIDGGSIYVNTNEDGVNVSDGYFNANGFYMSGGSLYINAAGDGLDSNANINVTGGSIVIEGPTANDNGAIDYDTTFVTDGGTIIAVGSAGMPALPTSGIQTFLSVNVSAAKGDTVTVTKADGTEIASIVLSKKIGNVFVSTNALTQGESYNILVNGNQTATAIAGEGAGFGGRGGGQNPPPRW